MIKKKMVPITTRRPWTEDDKRIAKRLRENGMSFARIADMIDRSESAVRTFFGDYSARHKLPGKASSAPWMDDKQIIREWQQAKDQEAQILILAELNDVSREYIERIIIEGTA